MKILRNTVNAKGQRTITIRLEASEGLHLTPACLVAPVGKGVTPVFINDSYHYRLGGTGDVVHPDYLTAAEPVTWCSARQEWVEA